MARFGKLALDRHCPGFATFSIRCTKQKEVNPVNKDDRPPSFSRALVNVGLD